MPELAFVAPVEEAPAADPPITLTLRLDGVQLARYEALLAGLAALVEDGDLRRRNSRKSLPQVQIVVKKCPVCERVAVVTNRGEQVVDPAQAAALICDARVREDDGPNRASIPPSLRAKRGSWRFIT